MIRTNRTLLRYVVLLLLVIPVLLGFSSQGQVIEIDDDIITFTELEITDEVLRGPYDSMRVQFSVPPTWALNEQAAIRLHIGELIRQTFVSTAQAGIASGATLEVSFNDVVLDTILLDTTSEQIVTIPITAEAIAEADEQGRHTLLLFMDASVDCNFDNQTTLVIESSTELVLSHDNTPPSTDLRLLPWPLYQRDSILINSVVVVVPDNPTEDELQAAFIVGAAMGRLTTGDLVQTVVQASELTPLLRDNENLIMVGQAASLGLLDGLDLPADRQGDSFDVAGLRPDDGVLQMAVSPWNEEKVLVVVGGETDAAVIKAAQALSSDQVRVGLRPDLAVVENVQLAAFIPPADEDRTLAELGYEAKTLRGYGTLTTDYQFYVPPGSAVDIDAYFNLEYKHSAIVDYARSGLSVELNGQPIGSARFDDETAQGGNVQMELPTYAIVPGNNRLVVRASLIPQDACSELALENLSTTISPESLLNLPLRQAQTVASSIEDLSEYPQPFINSPTLGQMAFVVPTSDSDAWNAAVQIAADLGKRTNGPIIELEAIYANNVTEETTTGRDLMIVGRPVTLPIIYELADSLPAPFEVGSNLAVERNSQVIYIFPEGTSIGYVQLLPVPWSPSQTIVAVLGSTKEGLDWSTIAMNDGTLRSQLSGDFAAVSDTQIVSTDTRLLSGVGGGILATAVPGIGTDLEPSALDPSASVGGQPFWVLPVLAISTILVVLIVVLALFRGRGSGPLEP